MHVGTLRIVLAIHDAHSLKDKRQVVKSLVETCRNKFNASVAEVDDLDKWQRATIGVACVSNDVRFLNQILDKLVDTVESSPLVEVLNCDMELL